MEHNEKGIIFNIQHFSVHDGPGIRTVVFLKGCPLRCKWCANPESQRREIEMGWTKAECIGCGNCIKQLGAMECHFEMDQLIWDTDAKVDAEYTKKVCPSQAFHVIGEEKTISEVLEEVEKDVTFYRNSGGGLTVSGGEPMMQPEFVYQLLKEAGARRIHRAIETCGLAAWEDYRRILSQVDYMLTDVKCIDDELHREGTGVSNKLILENLKRAREAFPYLPIKVRTPVIPGFNDNKEEISKIIDFVTELEASYELLRYHSYGAGKYATLGRSYPMGNAELSGRVFEQLEALAIERLGGTYLGINVVPQQTYMEGGGI